MVQTEPTASFMPHNGAMTFPSLPGASARHHEFGVFPEAPLTDEADLSGLRPTALAPGGRLYGVLAAAAAAGLTLVDPRELNDLERTGLHRVLAGFTGVYAAAETASAARTASLASSRGRGLVGVVGRTLLGLGAGVGAGVLTLKGAGLNDRVDATITQALTRWGVPAPRLLLAGVSAVALLVANRDARRARTEANLTALLADAQPQDLEDLEQDLVDLPVEARILLDTLLDPALFDGTVLPGAAALRAQLPHAKTSAAALGDPEDDEVADWLPIVVDTDQPVDHAVPNDATWPVRGRFTSDGAEFEVTLRVIDGELGALAIEPVDAQDPDAWDALQSLLAWPAVDGLAFHVDSTGRS